MLVIELLNDLNFYEIVSCLTSIFIPTHNRSNPTVSSVSSGTGGAEVGRGLGSFSALCPWAHSQKASLPLVFEAVAARAAERARSGGWGGWGGGWWVVASSKSSERIESNGKSGRVSSGRRRARSTSVRRNSGLGRDVTGVGCRHRIGRRGAATGHGMRRDYGRRAGRARHRASRLRR